MKAGHPGSRRRAYANQPPIAQWNLARLADAMMPPLGSDTPRAIERASAALEGDVYRRYTFRIDVAADASALAS